MVLVVALASTAPLVAWSLLPPGPEEEAAVGAAREEEPAPADTGPRDVLADPTTPAEVRAVVAFCDRARASDAGALRETALRGRNVLAAGNAIRALGRIGMVSSDPDLVALLRDPRERVRHEAILALGQSGDPGAVPHLEPIAMDDGDPRAQLLAIGALGRLGGPRADTRLQEILASASCTPEQIAFAREALTSRAR
jgi:HEAT repeat protein